MFQKINRRFVHENIENLKEHSWSFIFLTYILYGSLLIFIIFVIYQYDLLTFIQIQTFHLIQLTLLMSLLLFFLVVWLAIIKIGKLSVRELGLKKEQLKGGILFYLVLYLLLNLVLLLINLISFGSPYYYPYWTERGLIYSIGALFAQIFGNVLVEEVYYRGYLLNQITGKFYNKNTGNNKAEFKSIFKGVVLSSTMFAFLHIPIRIFTGVLGLNLVLNILLLIGIGVIIGLIYVFSTNLFFAMAVHVISNISFVLFAPVGYLPFLSYGLSFLIIFCLIRLKYRSNPLE